MTLAHSALLLLFAAACGGPPAPYQCEGIGFDFEPDCAAARRNVALARSSLLELLPGGELELEQLLSGLPIRVKDAHDLGELSPETWRMGHYDILEGVTLARGMDSLLHELLHHLDASRLSLGTQWHQGWESNGYFRRDEEYQRQRVAP